MKASSEGERETRNAEMWLMFSSETLPLIIAGILASGRKLFGLLIHSEIQSPFILAPIFVNEGASQLSSAIAFDNSFLSDGKWHLIQLWEANNSLPLC